MKTRRIVMSALGVVICGISVGMFKHASLGVDPFQSLMSTVRHALCHCESSPSDVCPGL